MNISGTVALKNRNTAMWAFNRGLKDQDSDNKRSEGSNEEPNIRIDPEAQRPQTRA